MSEYRIQSETLEAIGDAIRSKTGGSALIAPEDMATEIASISGGGSLPSGVTKIVTGTFTLAEDTDEYTITHNLGAKPNLILVKLKTFVKSQKDFNPNKIISYGMYIPNVDNAYSVCGQQKHIYQSNGNIIGSNPSFLFANYTTTTAVIKASGTTQFTSMWSDGNGNEIPAEYFWLCAQLVE